MMRNDDLSAVGIIAGGMLGASFGPLWAFIGGIIGWWLGHPKKE